jgi:hypothetical protein
METKIILKLLEESRKGNKVKNKGKEKSKK